MIVVRLYLALCNFSWFAALVLASTMALAGTGDTDSDRNKLEPDNKKKCKLIRAKRGGSAELIPEESRTPEQASGLPYVFDDTGLREDFRVDEEKRRKCLAGFGIFQNAGTGAQTGATGASTASAASAAGAVAPGGVAAAGAGIGTVAAGTVAIGIGAAVAIGAVAGVASAAGKSTSTPSTTP